MQVVFHATERCVRSCTATALAATVEQAVYHLYFVVGPINLEHVSLVSTFIQSVIVS